MKTDEGRVPVSRPHGCSFPASNAEHDIRKHIVKKHYIKGIIGLAAQHLLWHRHSGFHHHRQEEQGQSWQDLLHRRKGWLQEGRSEEPSARTSSARGCGMHSLSTTIADWWDGTKLRATTTIRTFQIHTAKRHRDSSMTSRPSAWRDFLPMMWT